MTTIAPQGWTIVRGQKVALCSHDATKHLWWTDDTYLCNVCGVRCSHSPATEETRKKGAQAMNEDETRLALAAFGAAAIDIALDCERGTDDDHAKDFGLQVDNYTAEEPDDKGASAILVKLEDGRVYRVYVGVVPATWPEPAMDPRD